MNGTNNSKPCNYVYFFLLTLLAITSFGFGTYYTEARMLKEGGVALNTANTAQQAAAVPQEAPRPEIDPTAIPEISDSDRVRGNANAKVALIEYSDLQCPYCQSFHQTVNQALEAYPDDLKWVYRHFPLSFHEKAMPRALAAECVAEQGGNTAFWNFIDEIFADQTLQTDTQAAVEALGLDFASIDACVKEERFKAQIDEQYEAAAAANVTGTPGVIVINTETKEAQVLPGAVGLDQIKSAVDAVLD